MLIKYKVRKNSRRYVYTTVTLSRVEPLYTDTDTGLDFSFGVGVLYILTLAIRTTVVPITLLIGMTVVRITLLIGTTGKPISMFSNGYIF